MKDEYPEADTAASYLLREASKMDVPDEELEDVDWSEYNTDDQLEDHGITAPTTDEEGNDS
jgi:hypothetical protein